jgi:hypothetical protein
MTALKTHRAPRYSWLVASTFAWLLVLQPSAAEPRPGKEGPRDPETVIERSMGTLTRELELSEEQQAEVRPILVEQAEAMFALRDAGRTEDAEKRHELRNQVREIHKRTGEQLQTVLDQTQMQQYRELMERRREEHRGRARDRNE